MFAYGSLMWRPGFEADETVTATLHGYHRAMCILSHLYRGSKETPGLVLGLVPGGSCLGVAMRVGPDRAAAVRAYLIEREMINGVYAPRDVPVRLADGRRVIAYTFVAAQTHDQHVGRLETEAAAALIRQGVGKAGTCRDYLANTVDRLVALGQANGDLHRLLRQVDSGVRAPD